MSRKLAAYALGELLPGLPELNGGKTRAPGRVWHGSSKTKEARTLPMSRKQAVRIWHKARRFDQKTRQPGRHGGAIGRTALIVLHAMLFDFLNYQTGRLDPSYDGIARRANVCRRAVASALKRLKALGVIHWLRRCSETRDAMGRFQLVQDTNSYVVLPPSHWLGYEAPPAHDIHPTEWGAVPPLPWTVDDACMALSDGASAATAISRLEAGIYNCPATDTSTPLAASLAAFCRTLQGLTS